MHQMIGPPDSDNWFWCALFTRPRAEKNVASMLDHLGIGHFLPLVTEVHKWSDRLQTISTPLFPCYLFVQFSRQFQASMVISKLPGVLSFVGSQTGPQEIPRWEIEAIHTVLSQSIPCNPCPASKMGDRVRVRRGLLAGVEGTLIRSDGDTTLVISVESIRQSISVHVDACDVEPLCDVVRLVRNPTSVITSAAHLCGAMRIGG